MNIILRDSLIVLGLLIPAAGLVLLGVRVFAGRGIMVKIGIGALLAIVVDAELGFILGLLGISPLSVVALYGIGILTTLILFISLFRVVVVPIQELIMIAKHIAVGDLSETVAYQSRDEIGELAEALRRAIVYQRSMASTADHLAQGDVKVEMEVQSERDVLGNVFRQMVIYQQGMADAAVRLAQGDVMVEVLPQSERDVLGNAFAQMIAYQQTMAEAAARLA